MSPRRTTSGDGLPGALSPEELSRRVMERARRRGGGARVRKPIPAYSGERPPVLSFAQERLWLLDRLEPGNVSYNMPFPSWLRGPLRVAVLAAACSEIARRQGSLRTHFEERDGRAVQIVAPPRPIRLPVVDLSGLTASAREPVALRLLRIESSRPFDLARPPLWRTVVLRLRAAYHALALTMHHIISDGWSLDVFYDELSQLYGAFVAERPSPLPELQTQYVDFAVWQRGRLEGDELERQMAYWRQRLAGAPSALDLPLDHPRPSRPSNRGRSETLILSAERIERLETLARAEGVTLFMLLLTLFKVLLSRLSGQRDVVVGAPSAGRGRVETEPLIGFFLNPLVLRTDLAGNPTVRQLLVRVKESVLGAYSHQQAPFEKVIAELNPERALSQSSLFQVQFNMLDRDPIELTLTGLEIDLEVELEVYVKFDLSFYVQRVEEGLGIALVYNIDLFSAARMQEFLAQFDLLLRQAVVAVEQPIDELSLRTESAAAVLPDPRRETSAGDSSLVHELFARRAAQRPEALALADENGEWNYGELADGVDRLARWLVAHGVERGDGVAILASREATLGWALLATLAAGGAFLILDGSYPPARLSEYVRLARPKALLTLPGAAALDPELARTLAQVGCTVRLTLPLAAEELPDLPKPWPALPELSADDLACLTFTSGVSGSAKAVAGRHGPLTWFLPQWVELFGFKGDDRFGVLSALAHDPLQRDFFMPLCLGGAVVVPRREVLETPGSLAPWLADREISVLNLAPAMLELVVADCEREGVELPALHHAFLVGDLLKRDDVEHLISLAPQVEVINLYGSTETQRAVAMHRVASPAAPRSRQAIALGSGFEGVQLLILGPGGRQAGVGELGEIWMRSRQLARGYYAAPGLTADRFRPNPLALSAPRDLGGEEAAGLDRAYRTGDLGRYQPNGDVDFFGRIDLQVQVRGFRIELGEVEAALRRQPSIDGCCVVAPLDGSGHGHLVAYVTPAAGVEAGVLRSALARELPDYMLPNRLIRLETLPMTRTGKVDRGALLRRPLEENQERAEERLPRTPIEELIAVSWQELLGGETVTLETDFFAAGGHSLTAIRLLARIRSLLGVELSLRTLFEAPTVAGLAARVVAAQAEDRPVRPPLARVPRGQGEDLPLSFGQQRLWFLDQLEPGVAAYNLSAAVAMAGVLEPAALAYALRAIVTRHQALRSSFPTVNGEARLAIAPRAEFALPCVDLSALPPGPRQGASERLVASAARRPFDLARGPLLRALLLRAVLMPDEERHVLALCVHHAVADGWSLGVMVRELGLFYSSAVLGAVLGAISREEGKVSGLPPLTVQYPDFARWQRDWLRGETLEGELAFWVEHFAGAPRELELATDRPRPAVRSYRGHRISERLPQAVGEALEATARLLGATPFMLLLAVWTTLLSRSAHQDELVMGTPVAGRDDPALEPLIGFFANTLALRIEAGSGLRFDQLVRRVRDEVLAAFAHPDLPFERLVSELDTERALDRAPVFQVMFSLQNTPPVDLEMHGLELTEFPFDPDKAAFDLTLSAIQLPDGLHLRLEAARDLFDRTTAQRQLRCLREVLVTVLAEPTTALAELPLLAPAERHQLLVEANDTALASATGRIEETLFAVARQRPDAVALVAASGALSYGELARRVRCLGQRLALRGVGPEVLVALAMPRDLGMVVGMLGVLAAGGAYLPLDPSHPAERLRWILEDATVALLLASREALELLPPTAAPRLELERDGRLHPARARGLVEPMPVVRHEVDSRAYVLYTSGSTGRPKGVEVSHRSVGNFLSSMALRPGMEANDVMLAITTLGFDISVLELLLPLSVGGRVELVETEVAADPALLMAAIERCAPTVMQATPAGWRLLMEGGWRGRPTLKALCGGEALVAELAGWLAARCSQLWNVYGPTETTVWSSAERIRDHGEASPSVTVGRPIANTQIVLADPRGWAVALGVEGELLIGGAGVTRGYLGRPALTAERFVPDPFAATAGARIYRTGDLARRRVDSKLEVLGRLDSQVKVRGFRIELGEIESVLETLPEVARAVVLVQEEAPGERRLVAYLVASAGVELESEALRSALGDRLPAYMIPALLMTVERLPLNSSGKIDRKALAAIREVSILAGKAAFVAPRGAGERALAAVWSEVLGCERLSVEDNFFALGGDSILAIRVVSMAADRGLHFTPRDLFRHPTVAALAALAEDDVESDEGWTLTPAQRWLLAAPSWARVGEVRVLRPPRPISRRQLEAALRDVVATYPRLGGRFVAGDPIEIFEAGKGAVPTVSRVQLTPCRSQARQAVTRALLRRLNSASGPLLVAALVDDGGASEFYLAAHPLALDESSWPPMLATLVGRLEGEETRSDEAAPTTRTLVELGRLGRGAPPVDDDDRWRRLAGQPAGALASDVGLASPPDAVTARHGESSTEPVVRLRLSTATTQDLTSLSSALDGELSEFLLAATLQTLCAWSACRRLVVVLGAQAAERSRWGLAREAVGAFAPPVPVMLEIERTLAATVPRVRRQLRRSRRLAAIWGLTLPAELTVEVGYRWWRAEPPGPGWGCAPAAFDAPARGWLLAIQGSLDEGSLVVEWSFDPERLSRAAVEALAAATLDGLRSLVVGDEPVQRPLVDHFPDAELSSDELESLLADL